MGRISFKNATGDLVEITGAKWIENFGYFEISTANKIVDYLKGRGYDIDEVDYTNKPKEESVEVLSKYQSVQELDDYVHVLNHFIIEFSGKKTNKKGPNGEDFYFGKFRLSVNIWLEFDWMGDRNSKGSFFNFLYHKVYWRFFKDRVMDKSIGVALNDRNAIFNIVKENVFD